MISLYILLIASIVAIFGLIVTIFSYLKKVDRSKRMGHFFLVFGIIVAIIAGFSMNKEQEAHQAAIAHQEKLRAEQIYDAGLIHTSDKKVRIKDGQAKVTIHVSTNTTIKIHSSHEQLHDLDYKPIKKKKDIRVTFVMPGKYTVTATRGQNKVVKHIIILKSNQKEAISTGFTSTSSISTSESVESETSSETIVENPTDSEDTSSETVIDSSIPNTDTSDTGITDVTPSTDYQPVWTPSESTPQTSNGTINDNSNSATTTTETSDSATTSTTAVSDEQSDTAGNIGE